MNKRYVVETTVGVFVFVALVCVGYLTIQLGQLKLLTNDYYSLKARFSSVSGLREGNDVQISGVKVGRVSKIYLGEHNQAAFVVMKIRNDIRLSDDTIASIKTSGLIGDKYISLSPGGSGFYLKAGDTIIETQSPIDFEEIVSKYVFGSAKE